MWVSARLSHTGARGGGRASVALHQLGAPPSSSHPCALGVSPPLPCLSFPTRCSQNELGSGCFHGTLRGDSAALPGAGVWDTPAGRGGERAGPAATRGADAAPTHPARGRPSSAPFPRARGGRRGLRAGAAGQQHGPWPRGSSVRGASSTETRGGAHQVLLGMAGSGPRGPKGGDTSPIRACASQGPAASTRPRGLEGGTGTGVQRVTVGWTGRGGQQKGQADG